MTSKEFIQNKYRLQKTILFENRNNFSREKKILYADDLKNYNQVLKDLDELEELKKVMGTPIQEIMKKLTILNILQIAAVRDELFKLDDDGVGEKHCYVLVDYDNYHASYITPDEYKLIKEWLGND